MMKQQLGCRQVGYMGRERNAFGLVMILAAYKIKRSLSLRAA